MFQLAPVVRQFRERNPDVRFYIEDGVSASIVAKVQSGVADFGITSHGMLPETLDAETLLSDRMFVVVPSDHRFVDRAEVCWAELAHEDVIGLKAGSSVRPLLDAGLRGAGLELQPLFEASQLVTIAGLIAAGLGVCPLPELATQPVLRVINAVAIPLVEPVVHRRISLLQRAHRPLQPAAQLMLQSLRENLANASLFGS